MTDNISRRSLLTSSMAAAGAGLMLAAPSPTPAADAEARPKSEPFRYCLNMGTIRGQNLTLVEEIETAAKAGYDGVEPWSRKIDAYVKEGGSLKDLGKRISDLGLTVDSAIAFSNWIVDDDAKRAQALEEAKRNMDALAQIGGTRIAAPPAGATDQADLDLFKAAQRYRALLELGDQMGVVPQVEVWGFSKSLARLGEAVFVAIESGHPHACLLPDVYHVYKGGSEFDGLQMVAGNSIHVFHANDYPADPPRETINDSHRVYPGDGVAPLTEIYQTIYNSGFRGTLSLELFNREYWKQDALTVAQTGLEKMRTSVQKAFA
ncbi:Inosose isomerase [Symmachiella macrocystis]|uniref:Inosose isomerase n=1 Tax=Symmachiella macrocystis TaxID=2527985 RepID=A0A5C6BIC5_9PLAN|nr:sugar phosphate isomerase/epimerase family protein [Symmachiella macrocystis]TWU11775.1 Inosose isomerase [Symmachiella macrocystis]